MGIHLVLGAGGIGRASATALLAAGEEVLVISRSGPKNLPEGATGIALDLNDTAALTRAAAGASTIVNAVNPSRYWRWAQEWPPVAASMLQAAQESGAGLVTVSNLYGYGRVDAPMTESTPVRPNGRKGEVRAQLWADALAAHDAGRCRVTEVRPSDYFGPGANDGSSVLNTYVITPAVAGRAVSVPLGRPDAPHSWTYLADIGNLVAALALGDGWGRVWHVPTNPPMTFREVAAAFARAAGQADVKVSTLPRAVVTMGGWFSPMLRELWETRHQFERPFVLDSSAAEAHFGLRPTPWEVQVEETVAAFKG